MDLNELLDVRRGEILEDALANLERSALTHYTAAGAHSRRRWLEALFDRAADSMRERNLLPLHGHVDRIAHERFVSGFDITEVQASFNALEEALWRAFVAEVPAEELVEDLAMVGTVLGRAKDRLAEVYVRLATQHHTPALDVDALFDGTAT